MLVFSLKLTKGQNPNVTCRFLSTSCRNDDFGATEVHAPLFSPMLLLSLRSVSLLVSSLRHRHGHQHEDGHTEKDRRSGQETAEN